MSFYSSAFHHLWLLLLQNKAVVFFFSQFGKYTFVFSKPGKSLKKIEDKNHSLMLKRLFLSKKGLDEKLVHILTLETWDH